MRNQRPQTLEIQIALLHFSQQAQARDLGGWNLLTLDDSGTRKEVTLKQVVPGAAGPFEIVVGLDLFREHGHTERPVDTLQAFLFGTRGSQQIDLNDVGQAAEWIQLRF